LGAMGDAGAVLPLARAAARSAGDGKKAARESLDGLSAPGVNDSLAALLGRVEAAVKLELLRSVGVRCFRATAPLAATVGPGEAERTLPAEFSGMPLVLGAAKDPDREVRIESAKTLRAIAGADQVKAMIGLLRSSRDESFRREMELSIASAALRGPPPPAAEILQAYASVNDVPSRIALINILGKTGGAESIPLLRRTLHDPEADIRLSSIRALSSWPTAQPYGDLRTVAGTARSSRERILALRGAVRLIGLDSSASTDETVRRYRDAMRLAPDAAERTLVISSLGETRSIAALRMAGDYLGDRDLHGAAESAALNIAQNIPDSAQRETVPILKKLISSSTDSGRSEKARTLLAAIEIHDDYITAWEYAGPFADSDDRQLDIPFTPELSPGAYDAWTALPAGTGKNSDWLPDLDGLIGGDNGVVYLRTNVWSPSEGNARLEAGSNYGIKIWWNGKIVHASTALRSLSPGSDRIPVVLKGGWNTILVKVEQGERPWGACLRVRAPDGSAQEGVRASTVQN
ncbi:MAG TPA: hypothetical protein VK569_05450, partial [Bacteroidota bacterium]|nr:hypothetical protein [Bacteroidota bacterium]